MKKAIFHLHTHYSFDCMTSPKKIVDLAVKNKIDYLVISDHDSVAGSVEARAYAEKYQLPIQVPISAEFYTDIGDIVAVGIPADFQMVKDHRELCRAVKASGGHTILPHPYDHHRLDEIEWSLIDCIEVFNSRSSAENNKQSYALAATMLKPMVYGSDAHFLGDVCNCIFDFDGVTPFEGKTAAVNLLYTSPYRKDFSQLVRAWKIRSPRVMYRVLKRIAKRPFSS